MPKSALRFYPPDKKYVHPDDHKIIDGANFDSPIDDEDDLENEELKPAGERVKARKKAKKRHVWKLEGELLRAIEVEVGLSDNRFSELVAGDVDENTELVIGQKAKGEQ